MCEYYIFAAIEGRFRWVIINQMVFSTSIDSLKSFPTVRRKFFSIIDMANRIIARSRLRSFRSFARITYASQSHDFLLFNRDHGKAYW